MYGDVGFSSDVGRGIDAGVREDAGGVLFVVGDVGEPGLVEGALFGWFALVGGRPGFRGQLEDSQDLVSGIATQA